MEESRKSLFFFVLLIFILCFIMALVELTKGAIYPIKSVLKWLLFIGIPLSYMKFKRSRFKRPNLKPEPKKVLMALGLGVIVYFLIIGSYFLFRNWFDFSNIAHALAGEGIHTKNFLYVALYISFINSLLEEFFFRVFVYYYMRQWATKWQAMFFSATVFSLYHIAIMNSWFTPILFILLIFSLFVAGLMFLWINDKTESFYSSWIIHMFANFSINTIGLILLGMI
ncbi:MAG TPA: type II CAAX endopeptidase family protein [Haloplasmataceae bacterium]